MARRRPQRTTFWSALVCGATSPVWLGCQEDAASQTLNSPDDAPPSLGASTHPRFAVTGVIGAPAQLRQPVEGVYTGGAPDDRGLDALEALGVRTVISVDAGTPRVDALEARGMRSVHLPLSYGRMDARSQMMLAKAVRELEGPVYIHCHHGKHRGPAAAAVALRQLDLIDAATARAFLVEAETSTAYDGLWRTVEGAAPREAIELDRLISDFPEIAPVPGFQRVMAESEHIRDRLEAVRDAGWTGPAHHPDLVPAAEAGRLADLFDALAEREEAALASGESVLEPSFAEALRRTAADARALEALFVPGIPDPDRALEVFDRLINECRSCHQQYRG